jgi:tagatose 1,6-diphosphate aldolase
LSSRYPYSLKAGAPLTGEQRRHVVIETARRLTAVGGDILKAEFPYDATVTEPERWAEACAELHSASQLPRVLLSGGLADATFELQVRAACKAGASGIVAGRAVWAEAATMSPSERDMFLSTVARNRLCRLTAIVDELGRSWEPRWRSSVQPEEPREGWYHQYRALRGLQLKKGPT